MLKKLLCSLIFAGSFSGLVIAQGQDHPIVTALENQFGKKRSNSQSLAEGLTVAFLKGGADIKARTFNLLKGATAARDGVTAFALEQLFCSNMAEFLKNYGVSDVDFKLYGKFFTKRSLDFALQAIKYGNGDTEDKSVADFMKNVFVPRFAKKAFAYWAFIGIKSGLGKTKTGRDILAIYTASQMIPLLGLVIDDLPEDLLADGFEAAVAKAKAFIAKIKQNKNRQEQLQPVIA